MSMMRLSQILLLLLAFYSTAALRAQETTTLEENSASSNRLPICTLLTRSESELIQELMVHLYKDPPTTKLTSPEGGARLLKFIYSQQGLLRNSVSGLKPLTGRDLNYLWNTAINKVINNYKYQKLFTFFAKIEHQTLDGSFLHVSPEGKMVLFSPEGRIYRAWPGYDKSVYKSFPERLKVPTIWPIEKNEKGIYYFRDPRPQNPGEEPTIFYFQQMDQDGNAIRGT